MKKKNIVTVVIIFILLISSISQGLANDFKYYFDVFDHWAIENIMWASNEVKLFNGYEDGTFRPDNKITIAEYTSLLYRAGKNQGLIDDYRDNVTHNYLLSYIDLNDDFWGYNEINTVASYINDKSNNLKFIDIFPGEELRPNRHITREEAVILASFFTSPPININQVRFEDINSDYKYIEPLTYLVNNKIIEGYDDNTFKPKQLITRAESTTIFMRLYNNMKYLNKEYLNGIQLVNVPKYRRFMLFGDYDNLELTTDDKLYRRAVTTLEYISIIHYIPYEERHLYDSNPIKTLKGLKDSKYWNVVGTNYYLINEGSQIYENNIKLYSDLIEDYILRDDIVDEESVMIFEMDYSKLKNLDKPIVALDKWYNSGSNYDTKLNSLFLKSKTYNDSGDYVEAIELYDSQEYFDLKGFDDGNIENDIKIIVDKEDGNVNETLQIDKDTNTIENGIDENSKIDFMELSDESKKCYFINKAYLLFSNEQYYDAEKVLRDGWDFMNSDEYDEEFIGAIKQVLLEIEKHGKLIEAKSQEDIEDQRVEELKSNDIENDL